MGMTGLPTVPMVTSGSPGQPWSHLYEGAVVKEPGVGNVALVPVSHSLRGVSVG